MNRLRLITKRLIPILGVCAVCLFLFYPFSAQSQSSNEFDEACLLEIARHRLLISLKKEYQLDTNIIDGKIGLPQLDSLMQVEGAISVCHHTSNNPDSPLNRWYVFQFPLEKSVEPIIRKLEKYEVVERATIDSVQTSYVIPAVKISIVSDCKPNIGLCENWPTPIKEKSWTQLKKLFQ